LAAMVPRNCFIPRPNVDSCVVCIAPRARPAVDVPDEAFFFALVKAAFAMRRKTLCNCWTEQFGVPKDAMKRVLAEAGFDESVRGEALGLEDFARLAAPLQNLTKT